jgi:hypothetical protein
MLAKVLAVMLLKALVMCRGRLFQIVDPWLLHGCYPLLCCI